MTNSPPANVLPAGNTRKKLIRSSNYQWSRHQLSRYQFSHFKLLSAQYLTLVAPAGNTKNAPADARASAQKLADEILGKNEDDLSWDDLCTFETVLIKLLPHESLRREAWRLRARYRDIAGEKLYARYLESSPPDPVNADGEDLRADLVQLLSEIHWLHSTVIPSREKRRNWLTAQLAGWIITVFLLGLLVLSAFYRMNKDGIDAAFERSSQTIQTASIVPPALAITLVIVCGTLGGFVSMQRRLQNIASEKTSFIELEFGWLSVLLSPISGAVFAMVLYLLFLSKLVQGELFPLVASPWEVGGTGITATNEAKTSVSAVVILWTTGPKTVTDLGKLLVWAFIAGFAERLVPDALDRLMSRADASSNSSTSV